MGKIFKILICGKKGMGKTRLLEQLIYSRTPERYFPTIEDIYIANWEKDKYSKEKEKFRFYDTKGLESSSDTETIDSFRYLFTSMDAIIFVYSSIDIDSCQCIDRIRMEIEREKSKEKSEEPVHYIAIDLDLNISKSASGGAAGVTSAAATQLEYHKTQMLRMPVYDANIEKREQLCKAFSDLANALTQVTTKSSTINLVQSIKKPKVFSSNK